MQLRKNPSPILLWTALLLVPGACGRDSSPQEQAPPGGAAAPSSPHGAVGVHPASFEGRVLLQGELAARDEGVLMINVVLEGSRSPLMATILKLSEAPAAAGGQRAVPFRLDEQNDLMGGGLPALAMGQQLELLVRYDADSKVETTEGDVSVSVPVALNATGLEVVLGGE